MSEILLPGYLKWDGKKFVTDDSIDGSVDAGAGLQQLGSNIWIGQNIDNSIIINSDNIQLNPSLKSSIDSIQALRVNTGDGLTGGDYINISPTISINADNSSIVFNSGKIKVGTITDTMHGNRAGGSLHANATTSFAGFMSHSDKSKLDLLPNTSIPNWSVAPNASELVLRGIDSHIEAYELYLTTGSELSSYGDIRVSNDFSITTKYSGFDEVIFTSYEQTPGNLVTGIGSGGIKKFFITLPYKDDPGDLSLINDFVFDSNGLSLGVNNSDRLIINNSSTEVVGNFIYTHGDKGGGTEHLAATTTVNGFMSAADKVKINALPSTFITDHGALTGLSDDDHTQYYNQARGDARYAQNSHTQAWSTITSTPTTFVGYGLPDVPVWDQAPTGNTILQRGAEGQGELTWLDLSTVAGQQAATGTIRVDNSFSVRTKVGAVEDNLIWSGSFSGKRATSFGGILTSSLTAIQSSERCRFIVPYIDDDGSLSRQNAAILSQTQFEVELDSIVGSNNQRLRVDKFGIAVNKSLTNHGQVRTLDGDMLVMGSATDPGINVAVVGTKINGSDINLLIGRSEAPSGVDLPGPSNPSTNTYISAASAVIIQYGVTDRVIVNSTGTEVVGNFTYTHGDKGGGTEHLTATTTVNGFMSAADKVKINALPSTFITDHGALTGLSDDDHTQYHNDVRGDIRYPLKTISVLAGNGLTGGGDLTANRTLAVLAADSSVDVSAGGIKINTITDTLHGNLSGGTLHATATTSVDGFMSAADKVTFDAIPTTYSLTSHTHTFASLTSKPTTIAGYGITDDLKLTTIIPVTIGTSNLIGVSTAAAKSDHVHAHGNQAGGALHSAATTSVNGFMSSTDKTKLNSIPSWSVTSDINKLVQRGTDGHIESSFSVLGGSSTTLGQIRVAGGNVIASKNSSGINTVLMSYNSDPGGNVITIGTDNTGSTPFVDSIYLSSGTGIITSSSSFTSIVSNRFHISGGYLSVDTTYNVNGNIRTKSGNVLSNYDDDSGEIVSMEMKPIYDPNSDTYKSELNVGKFGISTLTPEYVNINARSQANILIGNYIVGSFFGNGFGITGNLSISGSITGSDNKFSTAAPSFSAPSVGHVNDATQVRAWGACTITTGTTPVIEIEPNSYNVNSITIVGATGVNINFKTAMKTADHVTQVTMTYWVAQAGWITTALIPVSRPGAAGYSRIYFQNVAAPTTYLQITSGTPVKFSFSFVVVGRTL